MPPEEAEPTRAQRIYAAVLKISQGRVATYGQVAAEADLPRQARQVGYALAALPSGSPVPWHRVINAKGEISLRPCGGAADQRTLLEDEGVEFDTRGRVDLKRFRWGNP